jgi:hypothetical protein
MFTFIQRISVFAIAAVGLFAQSTPVIPAEEPRTSGMVGLVDGQAARLNVLNPGPAVPAVPAVGTACIASLEFWDGQGLLLKSLTVNVAAGKSAYLDLFGDKDLTLAGIVRREIRATISMPPVPATAATTTVPTTCKLIGTLEILDESTGKTQVVLGVGHVLATPTVAAGNP